MNISNAQLNSNILQKTKGTRGDTYLRLEVDQQTWAALPMKHAQEVIVVPVGRLTPIPNMLDCILGLLKQRSRVFWTIDLAQMLQLEPISLDVQYYNIAIVRVDNISLGLAVRKIQGVIRLTEDSIQSPIGTVSAGITPYLKGCTFLQREVLLILDAEAIINSSIFVGETFDNFI